jgi:hypothetical protein
VRTSRNKAGSFWGAGTNPDASIRQPLERLGCYTLQRQGQSQGRIGHLFYVFAMLLVAYLLGAI